MSETKLGIFPPYEKFINNPHTPWHGLSVGSYETSTYLTNVRPLTEGETTEVKARLLRDSEHSRLRERQAHLKTFEQKNREYIDQSDTLGIVLDGRFPGLSQGWLGDMIEASRLIDPLARLGKNLVVFTSNPDVFEGTDKPNVEVVQIPESPLLENNVRYPWNSSFREFAAPQADVFLFPMNAEIPAWVTLGEDGGITNQEHLELFKKTLQPDAQFYGIGVRRWMRQGLHQIQALQVLADLIGLEEAASWPNFPNAFLHPRSSDVAIAQQVIDNYHCLSNPNASNVPVFLHPGVATDDEKLLTKFYPAQGWEQTLRMLRDLDVPISPLVLLKPVDKMQALVAERLAEYAGGIGFHIDVVPMQEITDTLGWSLGAFTAFLDKVAEQNGLITGVDSMPAGHLAPALGIHSVVLGSQMYNPAFFSPATDAQIVMPTQGPFTSDVNPNHVAIAIFKAATAKKLTQSKLQGI